MDPGHQPTAFQQWLTICEERLFASRLPQERLEDRTEALGADVSSFIGPAGLCGSDSMLSLSVGQLLIPEHEPPLTSYCSVDAIPCQTRELIASACTDFKESPAEQTFAKRKLLHEL